MSNNKQSSVVDWIEQEVNQQGITHFFSLREILQQAKAMEKKQCVDFALKCMLNGIEPHQSTREVVERVFDEDNLQ